MPAVVEDLARLVAFPTVSDRPLVELAAFVGERLEDLGFRVERLEAEEPGKCNLVASLGPEGTDGLVLSGHMDVVPVTGQPWTSDPFRLTERDGRLVGRGTADMKGFLAATLQALGALRGARLDRELVLIWTHDEEVGCAGSGRLVERWDPRRPLPRACLIGEPTGFRAMRMHAGHVHVAVDVAGEAAHTSRAHLGDNAIETAAEVVRIARALAEDLRRERRDDLPMEAPWVPLVVARIHGGTAVNVVPDHCHVDLGYRPLPGMRAEEVFERLVERLRRDLGPRADRVRTRLGTVAPPMLTRDGTALAALLRPDAVPGPEVAPFATDGGNLARLGTEPIVFGPGSIDVAHKADEYVDTADLLRTVEILGRVIRARCLT
jgi:acetylornithine deacetylase